MPFNTTFACSHPGATHADKHGMPVAHASGFPSHRSPCCGSPASCEDTDSTYCKGCYAPIPCEYGGHPEEPLTKLAPAAQTASK
jgi:hypothetical protein